MDVLTSAFAGLFFVPIALIGGIPLFIYIYAILRWRAGSAEEPGMGSYSLVLMFRLVAVLLGLSSLSLLLYAALSSHEHDDMTRVCWPLLIAALIFLFIQFFVGAALGAADRFAAARRIFGGGLVAISGLITLGALIGFLVTMWEKTPDKPAEPSVGDHADRLKAFLCWFLCFGVVYLASAFKMARPAPAGTLRGAGPTV